MCSPLIDQVSSKYETLDSVLRTPKIREKETPRTYQRYSRDKHMKGTELHQSLGEYMFIFIKLGEVKWQAVLAVLSV